MLLKLESLFDQDPSDPNGEVEGWERGWGLGERARGYMFFTIELTLSGKKNCNMLRLKTGRGRSIIYPAGRKWLNDRRLKGARLRGSSRKALIQKVEE